MNTILLLRDRSTGPGQSALLEHQAISAIARSVLASPSEKGMIASAHKIIIPAQLDILPLIALVANDYTEFTEPESEKILQEAPFILYNDYDKEYEEYGEVFLNLVSPNWFNSQYRQMSLKDVIYNLKPDTCIVVGQGNQKLLELQQLDHRFQRMIGFSEFESTAFAGNVPQIKDSLIMADLNFQVMFLEGMKKMDLKDNDFARLSAWESSFTKEERKPELERLIHFGAATEMALFGDSRKS